MIVWILFAYQFIRDQCIGRVSHAVYVSNIFFLTLFTRNNKIDFTYIIIVHHLFGGCSRFVSSYRSLMNVQINFEYLEAPEQINSWNW